MTSWSPQPRNLPAARSMHLAWASTVGRGGRASASAHRVTRRRGLGSGSSKKDLTNFGDPVFLESRDPRPRSPHSVSKDGSAALGQHKY